MKVSTCSTRQLITSCGLERFDFQFDTYVGCAHCCHYCYVLRHAETDWSVEIQKHSDLGMQLGEELSRIAPQPIYIGYHSDPYQPPESEHRQTREALEVLQTQGFSAGILTKSDLVLRDLDILTKMEAPSVSVSVTLKDNPKRTLFEENTMATERRVAALRAIKETGIRTGALLCPVIPHLTETLDLLEELSTCADTIWIYPISGDQDDPADRGWHNTRKILAKHFPDIAEQTIAAIVSRDHPYWLQLRNDVKSFIETKQVDVRVHI